MNKLNLGCGEYKKHGYVNVDNYSVSNPDIRHDLDDFPYPFDSDIFDLVEADHLLEHLEEPFNVMKELHRITKAGGQIRIRVPHFSRGFAHAEHKCGFDVTFPLYFDPDFKGGYQGVALEVAKIRLRWFAQPYLKITLFPRLIYTIGITVGSIIDFFANISPLFCSRCWCFLIGGFEEIEIHFRVRK
tara:strand:- start:86 stop:646 length:561 start_codon:yes stop_codon:yes gene_type:complete